MRDPRDMIEDELDNAITLHEYTKDEFRDIARNLLGPRFDERNFEDDWAEFLELKRKKALN